MIKLKQIVSIFMLMFTIQIVGQSERIIVGKVIGIEHNLYLSNQGLLIPIELKNNKFTVKLAKKDFPDCISLVTISGKKLKYFSPKIWIVEDSVNIIFELNKTGNSYKIDKKSPYQNISEKIEYASSKRQRKNLIKQNIKSYPAIFFLYKNITTFSLKDLQSLYTKIPQDYKSNMFVERIGGYLDAKKLSTPGIKDVFKSFTLENKNKEQISIETSSSKYRLFAFVAYGCYFSNASISTLSQLHKKYSNQIDFITIWDTQSVDMWKDKKITSLITWTNLWDKNEFAFTYFNINIFPTFYLIDKNGKIIGINKNYTKLSKMIIKKLK